MEDPRILAAGGRILFCPSLVYNVDGTGRKLSSDCGMRSSGTSFLFLKLYIAS